MVEMRSILLRKVGDTSISGNYRWNPLVHGPFGVRNTPLVEGPIPVSRPSYRIGRERMEILKRLDYEVIASDQVATESGPWNFPYFFVPKRQFRLVQDFCHLN